MGKSGPPLQGSPPVNPFAGIPEIGTWASRMGKLADIYATPCAASPEAWVKAAFHSAPRLAYLVVKPFLIADQWHARTGRGHRKAKGIARLIELGTKKAGITSKQGFVPFKIAADFILKAEWYLMIIDRATEFAVNWSSLAYIYEGCNTPATRWVQVSRNDGYIITSHIPQLVGPMYGSEWPGQPIVTGLVGIPQRFTGVVNYSFSATSVDIPPWGACHSFNCQLVNVVAGAAASDINTTQGTNATGGSADSYTGDGLNQNTQLYGLFITGDGGILRIEDASLSMYAFQTGEKGLSFDP